MKLLILIVHSFLQYSTCVSNKDASFGVEESNLISTASIYVAALGRIANLGDLYDAKRDNFIDVSIHTSKIPADEVQITNNENSAVDYVRTESLSEKLEKLGVSAPLSVSFLGEMVSVSGSGKYLNHDKKTFKSAKASLVYSMRTVRESLNIFSKTSKELIDRFLLENIDATHVVVGIDWGADVVLSLEETNANSNNQQQLEDALKLAALSISNGDDTNFQVEESSTFNLYLIGDIIPNKVPQRINESVAFIRNIEEFIKKENGGNGKIIRYTMMPLATVQRVLQLEHKVGLVKDINQELTSQFLLIFQEMKDSELQIGDVYNGMNKWALMIPEVDFNNVSTIRTKFATFRNDFIAKFADLIVHFRNGEIDDTPLKNLITYYEISDWTVGNVGRLLATYTSTMHRIRLLELLESFNILFIDRNTDVNNILADHYQQEVRILSVDLCIDISSPYVRDIVRLLEETETARYYIEDDPDSAFPSVKVYLKGGEIDSFPVGKTEYVLLISRSAYVTIIDAGSYDQIVAYWQPEFYRSTIAIVNDTIYHIDSKAGIINSTNIQNIIIPQNRIDWKQVGSFPNETRIAESVAAVNGSILYFVSFEGILYKYDILLKTVKKCGSISDSDRTDHFSLVIVNKTLFIWGYKSFYSFDGSSLTTLPIPESRHYSGLFEFKGDICYVGGDFDNINSQHSTYCYDVIQETWTVVSYTNEDRCFPAVATTKSGIIIFGGLHVNSSLGFDGYAHSAEIFDRDTMTWSYIPTAPGLSSNPDYYRAISFYF